jgi:hypothetical protein
VKRVCLAPRLHGVVDAAATRMPATDAGPVFLRRICRLGSDERKVDGREAGCLVDEYREEERECERQGQGSSQRNLK